MAETMRTRVAHICNLKAILIWMVIFGHLIENMSRSVVFIDGIYRAIYMVHMPLFVFMAGRCSKNANSCARQIGHLLKLYAGIQIAACLIAAPFGGKINLWTPWWHTWFMLSMICWKLLGMGWIALKRRFARLDCLAVKLGIIAGSMAIGCLAGRWQGLGRAMSLSRSIVLLPYFWMGMFIPEKLDWNKYRGAGLAALATALGLLFLLKDCMPTEFMYHADGYAALNVANGELLRLACYGLGMLGGFGILTLVPTGRTPITRFGVDTLPIYLAHGPIICLLWQIRIPATLFSVLAPIAAMLILYLLYCIFSDGRSGCRLADGFGRDLGMIEPLRWAQKKKQSCITLLQAKSHRSVQSAVSAIHGQNTFNRERTGIPPHNALPLRHPPRR